MLIEVLASLDTVKGARAEGSYAKKMGDLQRKARKDGTPLTLPVNVHR